MHKHSDIIRQEAELHLRRNDKAGSDALLGVADRIEQSERKVLEEFRTVRDIRSEIEALAERLSQKSVEDAETLLLASKEITRLRTIITELGTHPDWEHISKSGRRLEPPKKRTPF